MSDFIDWDERLGEVRGRTLPEILLCIMDAAEGDRDRLKTSWMISDLDNFERATISRQAEAEVKMPGTITGSPLASVRKVLMEVVDLSKQVIEVSILEEAEVQPTNLKFTPPTEEGLYESAGQVWELQDDGFWNEIHGDGAEFGDHPFVKLVPEPDRETLLGIIEHWAQEDPSEEVYADLGRLADALALALHGDAP